MAPLDATEFSAERGSAGAAQHGSEAVVRNVAVTGRLEYVGTRGLQTGVSFWRGDTGFNVPRIKTSVGLYEFDARFSRGRLEARGAARARVHRRRRRAQRRDGTPDAASIRTSPSSCSGRYVEVAYPFSAGQLAARRGACSSATRISTRSSGCRRVSLPLPQFDRDAWVAGATYWVDPDVAIKFDYSHVRSQSDDRAAAAILQRRSGMVVLKG